MSSPPLHAPGRGLPTRPAAHPSRRVRGEDGFTLLEVLVALAIVAVAIFPLLQIVNESKQYAFDAKFTVIAANTSKLLLSEKLLMAKPGSSGQGNLADLQWDLNDLVADLDYVTIQYEWEVEEVDLSADMGTGDEEDEADPFADPSEGDSGEDIDDLFRARYAKVTIFYFMESGFERELTVETFLPPLPRKEEEGIEPVDSVGPNNG